MSITLMTIAGLAGKVFSSGIFQQEEPTPEEQKEKGRVWYAMLRDFVVNRVSPNTLASNWRDQLLFKQKATKKRFMSNNIIGKSSDQIIDTLVGKINDELVKGGFPKLGKGAILAGMGASGGVSSAIGTGTINSNVNPVINPIDSIENNEVNEGRIYFFVGGVILLVAGVLTFVFLGPKKRRR